MGNALAAGLWFKFLLSIISSVFLVRGWWSLLQHIHWSNDLPHKSFCVEFVKEEVGRFRWDAETDLFEAGERWMVERRQSQA